MLPMLAVSAVRAVRAHRGPAAARKALDSAQWLVTVVCDGLAAFGGVAASHDGAPSWQVWLAVALAAAAGVLPGTSARLSHGLRAAASGLLLVGTLLTASVAAHAEETYWLLLCALPPLVALVASAGLPKQLAALASAKSAEANTDGRLSTTTAVFARPRMTRRQRLNSYL